MAIAYKILLIKIAYSKIKFLELSDKNMYNETFFYMILIKQEDVCNY